MDEGWVNLVDSPVPTELWGYDRIEEQKTRGRPFRVCVRCARSMPSDLTGDHEEGEDFWCLDCWEVESFRREAERWRGRTVKEVRMIQRTVDDWGTRSYLEIEFADGSVGTVRAWGHDAWGIGGIELIDSAVPDSANKEGK